MWRRLINYRACHNVENQPELMGLKQGHKLAALNMRGHVTLHLWEKREWEMSSVVLIMCKACVSVSRGEMKC